MTCVSCHMLCVFDAIVLFSMCVICCEVFVLRVLSALSVIDYMFCVICLHTME